MLKIQRRVGAKIMSFMENKNNLATTAKEVMVPREQVLTCTMQSALRPILQRMDDNNFSHVLIMDGDVVCGIVSEKNILSIAAYANNYAILTKNVEDIAGYVSFEQACLEHFFDYISPDTPLNEVKELLAKIEENKERVDILIVTEEGRATGKFLGIITPWEIL